MLGITVIVEALPAGPHELHLVTPTHCSSHRLAIRDTGGITGCQTLMQPGRTYRSGTMHSQLGPEAHRFPFAVGVGSLGAVVYCAGLRSSHSAIDPQAGPCMRRR
jgi:hypothetical protein